MNKQELIKKYNNECFATISTDEVLEDLKQLDEPPKVTIPQFVADWIEECEEKEKTLLNSLLYTPEGVNSWVGNSDNQELFARAWIEGYEVEKEPKYIVKLKGVYHGDLGYAENFNGYSFYNKDRNPSGIKYEHTRKELEADGFGWVFDCPGIEIEEIEEVEE